MGYDYGGILPRKKVEKTINGFSIALDYDAIYVGVPDVSKAENYRLINSALSELGVCLSCMYALLENQSGKIFSAYQICIRGDLTVEKIISHLSAA